MSKRSINFDKKIKISDFCKNKNIKTFNRNELDVSEILVSKMEMEYLNTLLGIIIIILLDHYI